MILVDLIFGFIGEHLKFNRIKLKSVVLVALILFFILISIYCLWIGV